METLLDKLRCCYLSLPKLNDVILSVSTNSVENLDSILNQLEQRRSLIDADLTNTPLHDLPHFKQRLLQKVDNHVTYLVGLVRNELDRLSDEFETLVVAYEDAGRFCNNSISNGDVVASDLSDATESRPSIDSLFSHLDEIITILRNDLQKKSILLTSFEPSNVKCMEELRGIWKIRKKTLDKLSLAIFIGKTSFAL